MNDNTPNASKLIDSLRSTGYDNYSAIADLVDNSFDAHASRVSVTIGNNQDDYIISIADNGDGMDEKTLDQALRLGSELEKDEARDLGKFGMGLITASISLGQRLVVVTKQFGQYMTAVHDLDVIREKNSFVKELRRSTDQERNAFMMKTGGSDRGTLLLISRVDRLQNKNLSVFRDTLIAKLGEIFREYINAGKVIFVNERDVRPRDPLMLQHPDTVVLLDESHAVKSSHDKDENVRLRVVLLPKLPKAENDSLKVNIPNQGFYLMRNNRQIARGESLGTFTKHNNLNRFRAELFFSGSLDNTLGVGFTKDEVKVTESLRNWLEEIVGSTLRTIKLQAEKDKTPKTGEIDHKSSERAIKLKSKLLPDNESEDSKKIDPDWRKNHEAEVSYSTANKDRLGPMFTYESQGRMINITYNVEHPYYQKVFGEVEDDVELLNAMDFLTYSIAAGLSRITNEDTDEYIDKFMETFSSSLRTLLT